MAEVVIWLEDPQYMNTKPVESLVVEVGDSDSSVDFGN
jgi:hypothetical protein